MKQYPLTYIAQYIGATLIGDGSLMIKGVNDIGEARNNEVSFLANARYYGQLEKSSAAAIIVHPNVPRIEGHNYLVHERPSYGFQQVIELFAKITPSSFSGIHPTAVVVSSASIGENVTIGPYAVVDSNVTIASGSYIGPHVCLGPGVHIGQACYIHPHVVIQADCSIADYVIVQPGAIIGSCGFGYSTDAQGIHHKLLHVGNVEICSHVEIGANTTIDRARFASTTIGEGTKIDNLVQIAHNVSIGAHSIIVAQVGIAGSAHLGKHVVIGGQAGVGGHITLADGVQLAACSSITKSLRTAGQYHGSQPLSTHQRQTIYMRRIHELFQSKSS